MQPGAAAISMRSIGSFISLNQVKGQTMKCNLMFAAAVVAFTISATGALAADQPMVVEGQPNLQERVSYTDLDLRRSPDQRELRGRVRQAADRLCTRIEGAHYKSDIVPYGNGRSAGMNCADIAYRDASPQMRSAITSARTGEQMAMAAIIIRLARAR
jgi:UrcA family protein